MKDYRNIVPRTPPEGLREEMAKHLDTHGLIYEAVWVEEDLMAPIQEELKEGLEPEQAERVEEEVVGGGDRRCK